MVYFTWEAPTAASDFTHFRNRVGEAGIQKIVQVSINIADTLAQYKGLMGCEAEEVVADRGYRGTAAIGATTISTPSNGKQAATDYQQRKERAKFRRRAGIEPIISHIKHDFRMFRCYLKAETGDIINATMAAAAFNFKRWMREVVFLLLKTLMMGPFGGQNGLIVSHMAASTSNIFGYPFPRLPGAFTSNGRAEAKVVFKERLS
jgi:hypothetical protein